MSLIAQISQMGLATLQLPHGHWIVEVTKVHLHFSEIKSQAGNSFVNLARASLLYEMQRQRVAELFSCDNFLPACRPRRCSSNHGGALNLRTCKCPPPCMSVIHGNHAEKLVPLNLPRSSYTAHSAHPEVRPLLCYILLALSA